MQSRPPPVGSPPPHLQDALLYVLQLGAVQLQRRLLAASRLHAQLGQLPNHLHRRWWLTFMHMCRLGVHPSARRTRCAPAAVHASQQQTCAGKQGRPYSKPAHLLLARGELGNAPGICSAVPGGLFVLLVEPLLQLPHQLPAQARGAEAAA